jgi:putative phosphoesterase
VRRVAVLSDIHGNLPALEAVLADVEQASVDAIVVPGDTVSGPFAAEVFDLLTERGAHIVRGNADRLVLEGGEGAIGEWSAERLGDRLATVAAWPLTVELDVEGLGRALVCHATPGSDELLYTRITPDDELAGIFSGVDADVVVCGHTHVQYDRRLAGGLRIVNPGSVGMPYEGERGAFWALLGPDVELCRTEYDVEAATAAMRDTGAPDVEAQLIRYLLEPPDPDHATRFFESQRGA